MDFVVTSKKTILTLAIVRVSSIANADNWSLPFVNVGRHNWAWCILTDSEMLMSLSNFVSAILTPCSLQPTCSTQPGAAPHQ